MTPRKTNAKRNVFLKEVWQQFANYDHNAAQSQSRFFLLRWFVLALGVIATVSAMLYSSPPAWSFFDQSWIKNVLRGLVIGSPILMGILQSASTRFKEGTNYVLLRGAAEALKREIFRYRMKVDLYSLKHTTEENSRDIKLVRKMRLLGSQLMDTEASQEHLWEYQGPLPPSDAVADEDDGLSDLTADEYVTWRLEDQHRYYQRNMRRWTRQARGLQWAVYGLSALGSGVAIMGGEVWVVATTAIMTAVVGFQEYRRLNMLISIFNQASTDLDSIRMWWLALPAQEKEDADNIEKLVNKTEMVLRTEHADWMQEVRDALTELQRTDELAQQGAN